MKALPTLSALRRRGSSDHTSPAATAISIEKRGMEHAQHFFCCCVLPQHSCSTDTTELANILFVRHIVPFGVFCKLSLEKSLSS